MALYSELSDELEQTNRGVVALYAELDEKSERLRAVSESKAESGKLHIDPSRVSLRALFGRLSGLARPMAEGKPVSIVVSQDGAPDTILTDEVALTSILRNLLSNGIKYTDRGEVRLTARVASAGEAPDWACRTRAGWPGSWAETWN
jgi:signal transduction histidine kinase